MLSQDAPVTNSPRPCVPMSMSPTLKDARLSVETSREAYVSRGGKFARATMNRCPRRVSGPTSICLETYTPPGRAEELLSPVEQEMEVVV